MTFVRAARVANLLVATVVFLDFSVMSLVNRDGRALQMGLWLVPFLTVVILAKMEGGLKPLKIP